MDLFLLVLAVLCFYCTGASWMLQFVCYPTYMLVGDQEFVPFHVSFGRRLIPAAVVPMVVTCVGLFLFVFLRPAEVGPAWAAWAAAACAAVILVTTIVFEVPKHMALDKNGKSEAVLRALVRDNIPRTIAWSAASVLLAYMILVSVAA